jgi:hypothetical protein
MAPEPNTDPFAGWVASATLRAFDISRRFENLTVVLVGESPYWKRDLEELLPPTVDLGFENLPVGMCPDYVVIGQADLSVAELDKCLEEAGDDTRFLPQEGFLDALLFGIDWWKDQAGLLNQACNYYPGLAYVRNRYEELNFPWPSVEATPVPQVRGADSKERARETELHERGYNVGMGMTRAKRWSVLTRIIGAKEMSLRDVAGTIASHCRNRRRQAGGESKFGRALTEWEHDLARLKTNYYDGRHHSFSWPRPR